MMARHPTEKGAGTTSTDPGGARLEGSRQEASIMSEAVQATSDSIHASVIRQRELLGVVVSLGAACDRAIRMNAVSYHSIDAMLKKGLDRQSTSTQAELALPAHHENLRGASYFH